MHHGKGPFVTLQNAGRAEIVYEAVKGEMVPMDRGKIPFAFPRHRHVGHAQLMLPRQVFFASHRRTDGRTDRT